MAVIYTLATLIILCLSSFSYAKGRNPVPLKVAAGHTLWLNCTDLITDSKDVRHIQYYKSASIMFSQAVSLNRTLIIEDPVYNNRVTAVPWGSAGILNVDKQDEGDYSCKINFYLSVSPDPAIRNFTTSVIRAPPKPTATPNKNPVNEGDDVTLSCTPTAAVDGTPVYSWMKGGNPVEPGDGISLDTTKRVLTINPVRRGHDGMYTCSVTNIAGTETSEGLHLQVQYAPDTGPVITGYANNAPVDTGTSMTMTCSSTEGNPEATLRWHCTWSGFSDPGTGTGTLDLILTMEKSYHLHTCTCTAEHPLTSPDRTAQRTLHVLFAPGSPALEASEAPPWLENRTYTVTCMSDMGNPPNEYSWYVNDLEQTGKITKTFTMTVTKDDNQSKLRCNVRNAYSDKNSMTLQTETTLNVEFLPRVSVESDGRNIEGQTTSLQCTATSYPAAVTGDYHWTHVNGTGYYNGKIWSVGPLDKTYTGTYRCQVRVRSTGTHGELTGNSTLTLTVQYLELSFQQQNLTRTENERLQIVCSGEGEPSIINYGSWTHQRQGETRAIPATVTGGKNTLVVESAQYTDDGLYTCSAGNGKVQKQVHSSVVILYSPKNTNQEGTNIVFTPLGADVQLSQNVTAVPSNVIFAWTRLKTDGNRTQLENSSKTMIVNSHLSSMLYIYNVSVQDLGNYSLHASNRILNGSDFSFTVSPRGGPSVPFVDPDKSFPTPVSALLFWQANFDGGYTQTFSIHYRETHGGDYSLHRDNIPDPGYGQMSEERIGNLKPLTSYQFKVVAHNNHNMGTSVSSNVVTIQTLDVPTLDNSTMRVTRRGTEADLTWGRPSGINYDEQQIEQRESETRKRRQQPSCQPPACRLLYPGLNTTSYTATGLDPNKKYNFVLALLFMGETVQRQAFQKSVTQNHMGPSTASIVGGVLGSLVAVAVVAAVIVVFMRHRNMSSKGKEDREKGHVNNGFHNRAFAEDDMGAHGGHSVLNNGKPELKKKPSKLKNTNAENDKSAQGDPADLYAKPEKPKKPKLKSQEQDPQSVVYAQVQKGVKNTGAAAVSAGTNAEGTETDQTMLYAEVVKPKKGKKKDKKEKGKEETGDQPAVYAEVQKPAKKGKGKNKKKRTGNPDTCENVKGEMVYQNVGSNAETKSGNEETYSEVQPGRVVSNPPPGTEGLAYAAVEFVKRPQKESKKSQAPVNQDACEYAAIDYTKKGTATE